MNDTKALLWLLRYKKYLEILVLTNTQILAWTFDFHLCLVWITNMDIVLVFIYICIFYTTMYNLYNACLFNTTGRMFGIQTWSLNIGCDFCSDLVEDFSYKAVHPLLIQVIHVEKLAVTCGVQGLFWCRIKKLEYRLFGV